MRLPTVKVFAASSIERIRARRLSEDSSWLTMDKTLNEPPAMT
jgi:hypothetical protein